MCIRDSLYDTHLQLFNVCASFVPVDAFPILHSVGRCTRLDVYKRQALRPMGEVALLPQEFLHTEAVSYTHLPSPSARRAWVEIS